MDAPPAKSFKTWLAQAALDLGFARIGFASCEPFHGERARLEAWFAQDGAGLLPYLRPGAMLDPAEVMPGAATAMVVALRACIRGLVLIKKDQCQWAL